VDSRSRYDRGLGRLYMIFVRRMDIWRSWLECLRPWVGSMRCSLVGRSKFCRQLGWTILRLVGRILLSLLCLYAA